MFEGTAPCPLDKASPFSGEACASTAQTRSHAVGRRWIGMQPCHGEAGVRRSAFLRCFVSDADASPAARSLSNRAVCGSALAGAHSCGPERGRLCRCPSAYDPAVPDVAWLASRTGARQGPGVLVTSAHDANDRWFAAGEGCWMARVGQRNSARTSVSLRDAEAVSPTPEGASALPGLPSLPGGFAPEPTSVVVVRAVARDGLERLKPSPGGIGWDHGPAADLER